MYAQVKFTLMPVVGVNRDGTVRFLGVQLGRDLGQSIEIVSGLTGKERLVS
jgi:hypothetical protein